MPREVRPVQVTITRWVDVKGNRVGKGTPGARKVKERSQTWYAWLKVDGHRVRVPLKNEDGSACTDEGEAWKDLRRLQREERDRALGITSPQLEHGRRPLGEHVSAWIADVEAAGETGPDQVKLIRSRVNRLVGMAGWKRLPDLSAESCRQALAELMTAPGKRDASKSHRGRSAQTRNHYLAAVKQFVRWCVATGRLARDVLAGVKDVSVETDRRHDRRVPADAEVAALLDYLTCTPPRSPPADRCGMNGPHRALGYKVMMAAGLRADELRSLGRESFALSADPPTVAVEAAYSKHRRRDVQALPGWLAAELRAWFARGGECWSAFPDHHPGRLLKEDLEAAGVAYALPGPAGQPLYFDMHSLRHWYCTAVASQPGIDLKTLLQLTRHSTAELALKTYAKPLQDRIRKAVEGLADPHRSRTDPSADGQGT